MDNEIKIELQQKPKQDLVSGDYFKTKLKCHINPKNEMFAVHVETLHSNGALVAFLPRNLFENSKGIWKSGSNPFIRSISHLQSPPQKSAKFYIFLLIT